MSKSIVVKLFIITTVCISLFLAAAMTGQMLFFEKYYINKKISSLKNDLNSFTSTYTNVQNDKASMERAVNDFIDKTNAQIAVLDQEGMAKYSNSFKMLIETPEHTTITVPLNNVAYADEFQKLGIAKGSQVSVKGIYNTDSVNQLIPSAITCGNKTWPSEQEYNANIKTIITPSLSATLPAALGKVEVVNDSPIAEGDPPQTAKPAVALKTIKFESKTFDGKVMEIDIPSKAELMAPLKQDILWGAINNWFWISKANGLEVKNGEVIHYEYTHPLTGSKNIVFVKTVTNKENTRETVLAVTSLQPVGEAVSAMRDFYGYVFLVAILFIILLATLYSKLIARPLIRMKEVAVKMADLNFTEKCPVTSQDELGSLAYSLNSLSQNLKTSLDELQTANTKLQEDIEKERKLEKIRKDFVAGASHELKTPLGIIKGFVEGLRDNVAEEKKEHYIDVILEESEKMDGLIMDMLDLSKLESDAYKLKKENFLLHTLIQNIMGKFHNHLREKHIHVNIHLDSEETTVFADMSRMEQVVVNLFSNAVRYTPQGGFINCSLTHVEDYTRLSIENSGAQIPEDKLPRIWERFYRVQEARDRTSGGTGLGLAIVRNILELHGYAYGAKNTAYGVEFYIWLQ